MSISITQHAVLECEAERIWRRYFHDYVAFFEAEMDKKGSQAVINEYLFSRDQRSDDLLVRMFAGTVSFLGVTNA